MRSLEVLRLVYQYVNAEDGFLSDLREDASLSSEKKCAVLYHCMASKHDEFSRYIDEQVGSILDEQVESILDEQVESILDEQVESILDEQVESILDEQVGSILEEQVGSISEEQVGSISEEQVGSILRDALSSIKQLNQLLTNHPVNGVPALQFSFKAQYPGEDALTESEVEKIQSAIRWMIFFEMLFVSQDQRDDSFQAILEGFPEDAKVAPVLSALKTLSLSNRKWLCTNESSLRYLICSGSLSISELLSLSEADKVLLLHERQAVDNLLIAINVPLATFISLNQEQRQYVLSHAGQLVSLYNASSREEGAIDSEEYLNTVLSFPEKLRDVILSPRSRCRYSFLREMDKKIKDWSLDSTDALRHMYLEKKFPYSLEGLLSLSLFERNQAVKKADFFMKTHTTLLDAARKYATDNKIPLEEPHYRLPLKSQIELGEEGLNWLISNYDFCRQLLSFDVSGLEELMALLTIEMRQWLNDQRVVLDQLFNGKIDCQGFPVRDLLQALLEERVLFIQRIQEVLSLSDCPFPLTEILELNEEQFSIFKEHYTPCVSLFYIIQEGLIVRRFKKATLFDVLDGDEPLVSWVFSEGKVEKIVTLFNREFMNSNCCDNLFSLKSFLELPLSIRELFLHPEHYLLPSDCASLTEKQLEWFEKESGRLRNILDDNYFAQALSLKFLIRCHPDNATWILDNVRALCGFHSFEKRRYCYREGHRYLETYRKLDELILNVLFSVNLSDKQRSWLLAHREIDPYDKSIISFGKEHILSFSEAVKKYLFNLRGAARYPEKMFTYFLSLPEIIKNKVDDIRFDLNAYLSSLYTLLYAIRKPIPNHVENDFVFLGSSDPLFLDWMLDFFTDEEGCLKKEVAREQVDLFSRLGFFDGNAVKDDVGLFLVNPKVPFKAEELILLDDERIRWLRQNHKKLLDLYESGDFKSPLKDVLQMPADKWDSVYKQAKGLIAFQKKILKWDVGEEYDFGEFQPISSIRPLTLCDIPLSVYLSFDRKDKQWLLSNAKELVELYRFSYGRFFDVSLSTVMKKSLKERENILKKFRHVKRLFHDPFFTWSDISDLDESHYEWLSKNYLAHLFYHQQLDMVNVTEGPRRYVDTSFADFVALDDETKAWALNEKIHIILSKVLCQDKRNPKSPNQPMSLIDFLKLPLNLRNLFVHDRNEFSLIYYLNLSEEKKNSFTQLSEKIVSIYNAMPKSKKNIVLSTFFLNMPVKNFSWVLDNFTRLSVFLEASSFSSAEELEQDGNNIFHPLSLFREDLSEETKQWILSNQALLCRLKDKNITFMLMEGNKREDRFFALLNSSRRDVVKSNRFYPPSFLDAELFVERGKEELSDAAKEWLDKNYDAVALFFSTDEALLPQEYDFSIPALLGGTRSREPSCGLSLLMNWPEHLRNLFVCEEANFSVSDLSKFAACEGVSPDQRKYLFAHAQELLELYRSKKLRTPLFEFMILSEEEKNRRIEESKRMTLEAQESVQDAASFIISSSPSVVDDSVSDARSRSETLSTIEDESSSDESDELSVEPDVTIDPDVTTESDKYSRALPISAGVVAGVGGITAATALGLINFCVAPWVAQGAAILGVVWPIGLALVGLGVLGLIACAVFRSCRPSFFAGSSDSVESAQGNSLRKPLLGSSDEG